MEQTDNISNRNQHYLEETNRLLDELSERRLVAAAPLRQAWAIDAFLTGTLSVSEACTLSGVKLPEFREWLRRRSLSHLLDTFQEKSPAIDHRPEFSIVLPVFNEAENIAEIHRRLVVVLGGGDNYELLFVNDGSSDRSPQLISELGKTAPQVKLLNLSRNFGHQAAIMAGMDYSRGDAVIILDTDLQDPPEVMEQMIAKWRAGAKVVYAVRQKRKGNVIKRSAYFAFYRLFKLLSNVDMPLDSGDFCLLDRAVVNQLKGLPERNRFLRGLRSWVGFEQVAIPYVRPQRFAGKPKYNFRRLVRLALDGILSFSSFPLRFAAYAGFVVCLGGAVYLAFAVTSHFINNRVPVGWTSTVALILLIGGTQLLILGVLGEYIARVYDESKRRPLYIVESFSDGAGD
jgi:dolichol-phosphate mannosyltransferase